MLLDALIPCSRFCVSLIVYSVIYGYVLAYIAGFSLFVFTLKGGQSFFQAVYLLGYIQPSPSPLSQILSFYFVLNTPCLYAPSLFLLEPTPSKFTRYNTAYCSTAISNLLKSIFRLGIVYRSFLSLILILAFQLVNNFFNYFLKFLFVCLIFKHLQTVDKILVVILLSITIFNCNNQCNIGKECKEHIFKEQCGFPLK